MGRRSSISARFFLFFSMPHICFLCLAANTLLSNQWIKDGQTLVSANKLFQLRFFSPGYTNYRYVGIWHPNRFSEINKTVWVANRESPLGDDTGILTLKADGNLVVSYGNGTVVWSTNISTQSNGSRAVLEDNGNMVVREASSGAVLWESFEQPCDTLLPGMKIGINLRTGRNRMLTAWRSEDDPSPGTYAFGVDPQDPNQFFIWRRSLPFSRVIFWNGSSFNAIDENALVARAHDEVYLTISPPPGQLSWLVVGTSASFTAYSASADSASWGDISTRSPCSRDGVCGPNSSCNENQDPMCKCLPGYKPTSLAKWNSGWWQDGCIPRLELQCGAKDGYLTLKKAKLHTDIMFLDAENATMCRQTCDDSGCSCRAWAYVLVEEYEKYVCRGFTTEVKGVQEDAQDDEGTESVLAEVNIRVASSLLSRDGRRCGTCGSIIIPYPFSTEHACGDPAYSSFFCNSSSGVLYFRVSDGSSYAISSINPETRTFVIKPEGIDLCWAGSAKRRDIQLNRSLPFHVTSNNTVLLLDCSTTTDKMLHLDCSSSSPCHRYIQVGGAPCFHSKKCCSYITGGSKSMTSHQIGVLHSQCGSYASIVNLDASAFFPRWLREGVQIEWEAPPEPVCDSDKDCNAWPNSSCEAHNAEVRKRCLCNENFLWDPLSMNCTPDGTSNTKSLVFLTGGSSKNKQLILIVTATAAAVIFLSVAFAYCVQRSKNRRKARFPINELLELANGNDSVEVPFVDFKCIVEATENFSDSNKLGRGGFGPVYKGKLSGGQEVAIKKLSKYSGQGLEEFKNEVLLIAKLQHRNLVRMLGYCIEEDEKMLIYEYMPNKSLDFLIFDSNRSALLDWEKRFNIILGVTRGLLYLHQDSRLRIIHRDLKTSNILLDKDMNPKISDFGLARIFGGDQTQETTNRVVGTYGYMAPEYAADGLFSVKSDVFSFGIILLEIVSGRKNVGFYNDANASNLTGYAWQLWKVGGGLGLLDPCLCDSSSPTQVLRCIHLALLCVQENAEDRPTVASVLAELESETASLPTPGQPAFFRGRFPGALRSHPPNQTPRYSNNEITLSTLEGR